MIKKIIFPPPPSDVILNEGVVVGFKRIDKKKFQKIISLFVKDNYFLLLHKIKNYTLGTCPFV